MKVDKKVKSIINDIETGKLNKYLEQIDNSDFGFYIPVFEDKGTVKPMKEGYSQTEQNLVVTTEKNNDEQKNKSKINPYRKKRGFLGRNIRLGRDTRIENQGVLSKLASRVRRRTVDQELTLATKDSDLEAALTVGWFGNALGKDATCKKHCKHCKHKNCTLHPFNCRHCSHLNRPSVSDLAGVPELDYHKVVKEIDNKKELLDTLAGHGVGLTLLHGHNDEFMFTKLPKDRVSVIANEITSFRTLKDVAKDTSFVPNVWRVTDGKLSVAGGHSQIDVKPTPIVQRSRIRR